MLVVALGALIVLELFAVAVVALVALISGVEVGFIGLLKPTSSHY